MNGIASLPRYSYDPRTQAYTRLNPPPLSPEQQADATRQLERMNYGSGGDPGGFGDPGSGPGSAGALGGLGLGLMGYSELGFAPGAFAAGLVGNALADQSVAQNAATNAALAQMNEQAIQSQVTPGLFGPVAAPVDPNAVTVSPLGPMSEVSVSPIGPDATTGLAAMNAAQQAEAEAEASPAAVAAGVASAVSEAAEAADAAADAGADAGAAGGDGGGGDGGGGDGGDGGAGASGAASGDSGGATSGEGLYRGGPVMQYAQGGMPALAREVENQGRRGDSMLVHMTPQEVGGLQSLARMHGGSLSINPNTGLPEANFLKSILPMVAGAALAATGVGAPMAALMVGGGYGLATGSLSKGLMAGLGAFGGAGLGAGLSAAGATTAGQAVTPALQQATAVTPQAIAPTAQQLAGSAGDFYGLASQTAAPALTSASAYSPQAMAALGKQQAIDAGMNIAATPTTTLTAPGGFGSTVQQMGTGLKNVVTGTEGARGAFMSSVGGPSGLIQNVGAAAAPVITGAFDEPYETSKGQAYIRPFKYDVGYQGGREDFRYRTGQPGESTAEQRYFDSRFTPLGVYKAGTEPAYGSYAGGGLTALAKGGRALPPRYLEGAGDGMSDSIKARIGGLQEARLADGEFVIPADVVSHLGNGSSNAGAKKLHAMMDRIRKARTGKKSQAPEVKTGRLMPA